MLWYVDVCDAMGLGLLGLNASARARVHIEAVK